MDPKLKGARASLAAARPPLPPPLLHPLQRLVVHFGVEPGFDRVLGVLRQVPVVSNTFGAFEDDGREELAPTRGEVARNRVGMAIEILVEVLHLLVVAEAHYRFHR